MPPLCVRSRGGMLQTIKILLLTGFCILSTSVYSAVWTKTGILNVSELYTDNATSAPSSSDAQEELVTQIAPELYFHGVGRKVVLDLNYRLEANYYDRNIVQDDDVFHELNSSMAAELKKGVLFLDAGASLSQEYIDRAGPQTFNSFATSRNRTDVTTVRLSPYLRSSLSRSVVAEARYFHNRIEFDSDQVSDRSAEIVSMFVGSRPGFDLFEWRGEFVNEKDNLDSSFDSESRRVGLYTKYSIRPWLKLLADGGREVWISDLEGGGEQKDEVDFWLAGLALSPNKNLLIEGRYGERFFGSTYSFELRANLSKASLWIVHDEVAISAAQFRAGVVDQQNRKFDTLGDEVTVQDSELIVREKTRINLDVSQGRNSLKLGLYRTSRTFYLILSEERSYGGELSFIRALGSNGEATLKLENKRQQFFQRNLESDFSIVTLQLENKWGARLSSVVSYKYIKSDSPDIDGMYDENELGVRFKFFFL